MLENDPLIIWARQGDQPGTRVFAAADAIAVAVPALSRRNRLVVAGAADSVSGLILDAARELGPGYTPMGDERLMDELVGRFHGAEIKGRWAWLERTAPVRGLELGEWIDDDEAVAAFLDEVFPDSYARPGAPGVKRWAAVRDGEEIVATAAEAWSAPGLGFMAGVATRPSARGRGLASALCTFVANELLRENERVALFADYWNEAALRTYRKMGFTLRPLAAV